MPDRNNRHVVPNPDGTWSIKAPGARRSFGNYHTQAEAVDAARKIVGNAGGGELIIHGCSGAFRAADTVTSR